MPAAHAIRPTGVAADACAEPANAAFGPMTLTAASPAPAAAPALINSRRSIATGTSPHRRSQHLRAVNQPSYDERGILRPFAAFKGVSGIPPASTLIADSSVEVGHATGTLPDQEANKASGAASAFDWAGAVGSGTVVPADFAASEPNFALSMSARFVSFT